MTSQAASPPRASSPALSRLAGPLGWLVLVFICAAVYLPGLFTLPPVDRDESRFAQASRQMYESGDWAVPRVQDRPRLNKPPLIYWLQSASLAIFGDHREREGIWVYRIPSVLCATGAVLLTWRLGRRMMDPRAALLAAALLAASPIIIWDAHQARADQLLLFSVVFTQLALWQLWKSTRHESRRASLRWIVLFWFALGIGVLAKGPITPMIAALTALTLALVERRWRWLLALRPLLGILIVAAMVGPWVYRVGSQVGWDQYLTIIKAETLGRAGEAKEGHWGPPGYHLLLLPVLFWPGSLMTAAAVTLAWSRAGFRSLFSSAIPRPHRPAELFLLAWLVPSWIVFELVGTKLPHYTMPLYPALALLSARMVLHVANSTAKTDKATKLGQSIWILLGLGVCGLAPAAIWVALIHPLVLPRPIWIPIPIAIMMLISLIALIKAIRAFFRHDVLRAQLLGLGIAIMTPAVLIECVLAHAPELALSTRIHDELRKLDPKSTQPLAAFGYHEDSLIFLTRGRVQRLNAPEIESFFAQNPSAIAVAPVDLPLPPNIAPITLLTGFNYSIGKWTTVVIARRLPER